MTASEGRMKWQGHETWYRVVGQLDAASPQTPVVICHGGPGAAHDYCEPIADLSRFGRACVLYDQLGCGRSELLPDASADFWTPQLFKDELVELTGHLGIEERYAVVGQSWGGMLAMEHALDHPAGLRGLVVADSPASMTLWVSEANRLRADLPEDVQETLTRHENAGTTADPEYEAAVAVFYARHVCRIVPMPDCVVRSFAQIAANPTVYHAMNGPSEFHVIGSLKTWDITDRLHEIDTSTLLVSGRYDEATPLIVGRSTSASRVPSGSSSRSRVTCPTWRSPRRSSTRSRRSSLRSTESCRCRVYRRARSTPRRRSDSSSLGTRARICSKF